MLFLRHYPPLFVCLLIEIEILTRFINFARLTNWPGIFRDLPISICQVLNNKYPSPCPALKTINKQTLVLMPMQPSLYQTSSVPNHWGDIDSLSVWHRDGNSRSMTEHCSIASQTHPHQPSSQMTQQESHLENRLHFSP